MRFEAFVVEPPPKEGWVTNSPLPGTHEAKKVDHKLGLLAYIVGYDGHRLHACLIWWGSHQK
jgi:hypothetical protein